MIPIYKVTICHVHVNASQNRKRLHESPSTMSAKGITDIDVIINIRQLWDVQWPRMYEDGGSSVNISGWRHYYYRSVLIISVDLLGWCSGNPLLLLSRRTSQYPMPIPWPVPRIAINKWRRQRDTFTYIPCIWKERKRRRTGPVHGTFAEWRAEKCMCYVLLVLIISCSQWLRFNASTLQ